MSYAPPTVGPAGLFIPSYNDILEDNLAEYLKIYGANQYVGNDSAVYQLISIFSLKISDCCEALQYVYNQSSPLTAVGAGLDRLVKLNGIARLAYTYSTAALLISGTLGTVIPNGVAQDINGNQWLLPQPSITIPSPWSNIVTYAANALVSYLGNWYSSIASGNTGNLPTNPTYWAIANPTGTCSTPGNITAEPGTIIIIASPVGGWASVTNPAPAIPGQPIETDSQLRARQAISVAVPSLTRLAATIADIKATPGVTRQNVLENPTGDVDIYGNPGHSITCVVEGGTPLAVATAIYANRGIGCYTNGKVDAATVPETVTVIVNDPDTDYPMPINFLTPSYIPIYVTMTIHLLTGGTSATVAQIAADIVAYLNSLEIGESVNYGELWGAALNARSNPDAPTFAIQSVFSGTVPSPAGTVDIPLLFYQVAQGILANITVTAV